jgi:hypothetical protein
MTTIEVLDAAGEIQARAPLSCNPVLPLEGLRLAILDNGKPNFQRLASLIAERLHNDCSLKSIAYHRKENPAVGARSELLDQVAQSADVVLTGSAD